MRSRWLILGLPRNTQNRRVGWSHAVAGRECRPPGQMSRHQVYRWPTSAVAPAAGVAEGSQAEPVGGSGSHESASWAEEAGDIPGFFPNLVDPIPPISLGMLRGEGPVVVVVRFHAARSWLVIAAVGGGKR